ncbi:MAG: DUF4965 domain-containing protein [Bacteroidota bacterium]|nr:DUF4965 domain-containing protein [Bacteroidota bacterium]
MKKTFLTFCCAAATSVLMAQTSSMEPVVANSLRAPAYPLVTSDPYLSAWSFADKLYDESPNHWTGAHQGMTGALRVDGKIYRFLGFETTPYVSVVPMANVENWTGRYTFQQPAEGWEQTKFNDAAWETGKGAFGTPEMPLLGTKWETKDIWVRREFTLNEDLSKSEVFLKFSHDDIFELYVNGIQVVKTGYEWKNNVQISLPEAARKTLKRGKNVISAHCHNVTGGGYVDFGLLKLGKEQKIFNNAAVQKSATVMPTQTFYNFNCGPVELKLVFTNPLLMNKLEVLSRPVSYVTYQVKSLDGKQHDVQIYFDATPEWAVNVSSQPVTSDRQEANGLVFLKTGTKEQKVLGKKGDDVRIDWGYFYLTGKSDKSVSTSVGESHAVKKMFAGMGAVSNNVDSKLPEKMAEKMPVLAYSQKLGKVGATVVSDYFMIGYDDIQSIQYFGNNLLPYWKQVGKIDIQQAFKNAQNEYSTLVTECQAFDKQLMADAERAGGKEYADLCALAYRQAIAAHKLVIAPNGDLLFFSKENFSNGCINTVDVTYPSAPLFILYNPELMKGMLNGIFYFSESGKFSKPFPAHDLGTYPLANGQLYGEDMPVEEAGNMLTLTAAIAIKEGNARYAEKHWNVLSTWADYLLEKGLDPENQLCTDDFAGHSAHNTNLSAKAIMGIAAYGKLAQMLGLSDVANTYTEAARKMAAKWCEMANDGDHYRLNFDNANSWSQKYNLIWDKVLNLNIFPKDVAAKEIAYYLTKQNSFGLPLDSRRSYTKSDWILWTATLANDRSSFEKLVSPMWKYANEISTRMPLSDWHETTDGKSVGFRARSVVGGYFMKLLDYKLNGTK